MSNLDEDIIFAEILPRLPTKSLMRFKCVSNSFKNVISSPNFALLHHSLCANENDLIILPEENHIKCYDLVSSTTTTTFAWREGSVILVGSCNGLLCILTRNTSDYLSVLNPTTRICQDILIPPVNDKLDQTIGFAYDHQNLDFKIVHHFDRHYNSGINARITRIYSLNSKSWKVIKLPINRTDAIQKTSGKLINNNLLHWLFSNTSSGKYRIGCFDVCKNEWTHDVPLPHYYNNINYKKHLVDFEVLDNRLLFSTLKNEINSCFEVWVMNEYDIQDSWAKLLIIRGSSNWSKIFPWGVMPIARNKGSGKLLVRKSNSSKYFWYTKSYRGMPGDSFDEAPEFCNFQAYISKRSLVDVPGGKLFPGK